MYTYIVYISPLLPNKHSRKIESLEQSLQGVAREVETFRRQDATSKQQVDYRRQLFGDEAKSHSRIDVRFLHVAYIHSSTLRNHNFPCRTGSPFMSRIRYLSCFLPLPSLL